MRGRILHRLLMTVLALVALGLVSLGCRGSISDKPPVHPNWNMDQQARIDPQEPSDFFADGRGMRPPVDGTVARGEPSTAWSIVAIGCGLMRASEAGMTSGGQVP